MASGTGPPTEYDDADEAALEAAIERAWSNYQGGGDGGGGGDLGPRTPTRMTVSARVEWSGREDRARGGQRTVRLDRLDLSAVKTALAAVRAARARERSTGLLKSYRARTVGVQARQLSGTRAGRAALLAMATPRTVAAWTSGARSPSKANQARIQQAYAEAAARHLSAARAEAAAARHALAEAVNAAVRDRYNTEVRFRDIGRISFE